MQGAAETILIVEDDALIRLHGCDVIEAAGYDVIEAENADEAIALLESHHEIGLLFSDIDMPGSMDGFDLARLVHERWPAVAVLLTSGHCRPDATTFPDGRFLGKPWHPARLVGEVRDLLARS